MCFQPLFNIRERKGHQRNSNFRCLMPKWTWYIGRHTWHCPLEIDISTQILILSLRLPILHDTAGIASLVGHFSWWTEGSLELEPVTAAGVTILSPYCNITPIEQDRLGKNTSLSPTDDLSSPLWPLWDITVYWTTGAGNEGPRCFHNDREGPNFGLLLVESGNYEGPSWGLYRNCETSNFAKVRCQL